MDIRYLRIWKWLPFIALGLMLAGEFAPISDSLESALLGAAIAVLLAFSGAYFLQRRTRRADQSSNTAISSSDQT